MAPRQLKQLAWLTSGRVLKQRVNIMLLVRGQRWRIWPTHGLVSLSGQSRQADKSRDVVSWVATHTLRPQESQSRLRSRFVLTTRSFVIAEVSSQRLLLV